MNSNKFLLGGIVGGVVYFLLGYLFYGLLFKSFFDSNATTPIDMSKMVWWALIVGNLVFGLLLAYIIGKAKISSMGGGAGFGFVAGLLMALSFDLIMYATGGGATSLKAIAADSIITAVMSAVVGAAVVWVNGMGKKSAA